MPWVGPRDKSLTLGRLGAMLSVPSVSTATVKVSDTFTDTAGTAVESHTGEIGATWTKSSLFAGTAAITAAGRVRSTSSTDASTGNSIFTASGVPASGEYDIGFDMVVLSDLGVGAVFCYSNAGVRSGLEFYWLTSGQAWHLDKLVTGTKTSLASKSDTLVVGDTYHIVIQVRSGGPTILKNGTSILTSTDTTFTSGLAGIQLGHITTDTTGIHIDNFRVTQ